MERLAPALRHVMRGFLRGSSSPSTHWRVAIRSKGPEGGAVERWRLPWIGAKLRYAALCGDSGRADKRLGAPPPNLLAHVARRPPPTGPRSVGAANAYKWDRPRLALALLPAIFGRLGAPPPSPLAHSARRQRSRPCSHRTASQHGRLVRQIVDRILVDARNE